MYEKRSFKLINYDAGTQAESKDSDLNVDPRNSETSEPSYNRSTKNNSITTLQSKDLEFTGGFAGFLIDAYIAKGIEANVSMIEYRFHPNTDAPYIFLNAQFDFSQYSYENNIVKVPFLTGGLNALIKSKLSNKFETNRTTDINGNTIPSQVVSEVAVINRPLDLNSEGELTEEDKDSSYLMKNTLDNNYNHCVLGYPFSLNYESDDRFTSVIPNQASIGGGDAFDFNINGATAAMFYYNNDIKKTLNISLEGVNFDFKYYIPQTFPVVSRSIKFVLMKFSGGNTPLTNVTTPDYFTEILDMNLGAVNNVYKNYSIDFNINVEIEEGDSLQIGIYSESLDLSNNNVMDNFIKNAVGVLKVKELSVRNDLPRRVNCVLNNETGRCLFGIINGDKDTYKSEYLESGEFKLSALSSGKMIRGFKDEPLTTSLRDYFANCKALFNMAYNIEIINGKETLVHEPLRHFFRPQSIIKIKQQVNKVKRTVAKEFIYSSAKTGFKKPSGDNLYEEVNGLKEFNVANEFIFPINRIVNEYDNESPYRADSEGKELTVRQSIQVNPEGDYRTDKTIFNLDLKESGTSVYEERTYIDDFEEAPKNVFNPETVTGLRFTPFRNLSRHFWQLNAAFTKFTYKYIRYASSKGNSKLITKKIGEQEIKENGDYQINTLENAIFASEWIEFEFPLDYDLINLVNGTTLIEGRSIPNTYFKVEFINEFNKKEYGYLYDLKPKKQGKWKLLKAL